MKYEQQIRNFFNDARYIRCPECGRGSLQSDGYMWYCIWRDCNFSTSEIPSPQFLKSVKELNSQLDFLQKLKEQKII